MTKIKTLQWWNWGNTQDSGTLIKDAFERAEKDKPDISWWDIKTPTAIKEWVWKTWEEVVHIIEHL